MSRDDTGAAAAEVALHGLWPLVADPASAAGIRFADLGSDGAEDYLSDAEGLPEAEVTLRTFASPQTRDAWCAAAREFGGNALAIVPGPDLPGVLLRFVLAVRLDRDAPGRGKGLEGAIRLVREAGTTPADLAGIGARCRAEALAAARKARGEAAFASAWAPELDALRTAGRLDAAREGDPLALRFSAGPRVQGVFQRTQDGLRCRARFRLPESLDPDLADRIAQAAGARGWEFAPDGTATRMVGGLDAAEAAAIADAIEAIEAEALAAEASKAARTTLLALHVDPEAIRVLRRIADGLPLASTRYGLPAAQTSPRTGKPTTVASSRVERLFLAGTIVPVWWRDPSGRIDRDRFPLAPLAQIESILWGLTRTGRALVLGDVPGAAETQSADALAALSWHRRARLKGARIPEQHEGIAKAVAGLPRPGEAVVEVIAAALAAEWGLRWFPPPGDALALVGAGLAAGLVETDGRALSRIGAAAPAAPAP